MSAGFKLHEFLREKGVPYVSIEHPKRYTALETAETEKSPAGDFAKVVMVKVSGKDAMFVIPANRVIDLFKLSYELGTEDVRVEEENEFQDIFTDSEKGAMPPFGALYGIPVYMDAALKDEPHIFFNAGSHKETIKMMMKDYLPLAGAVIGDYTVPRPLKALNRGGGR